MKKNEGTSTRPVYLLNVDYSVCDTDDSKLT
jgi:hypothetical protein